MATLILTSADAGKTIPVSGSLDWDVYGTDAADTIEVAAGASAIVRGGAGTDVVKLLGGSADYTVKLSGSSVVFTHHTSTGKTVTVPVTSAGDSVSFGNGTAVTLKSTTTTVDTTSTTTVTLGAQTLSTTDAAVTGATGTATGATTGTTAGQSFSLTTGADISGTLVGSAGTTSTDGNDTFTATGSTYTTGDVINGGNGTDTLNVAITANSAGQATVVGVEAINVNATSFTTLSFDATGIVGSGTTVTFNNKQTAGATGGTINNVSSGAIIVAGEQMTGTLTVDLTSAASGVSVNAASAGNIAITNAGQEGVVVTSDLVGTVATPAVISVDGDGDTSTTGTANDAATIKAKGVVTLETAATDQVENLTLEGNGVAATFNLDATGDAPLSVTFAGSQSVTVTGAAAQFSTITVTDNTTAGTSIVTINDDATSNLAKVAADVINIADGTSGSATYSVANNATVRLSANTAAGVIDSTVLTTGAETLNLQIEDAGDQGTSINVSDFETVNATLMDSDATAGDGRITIANLIGSSAVGSVIKFAGAQNLTLTTGTSTLVDASAMTGAVTATLASTMKNIKTGSGNDVFTAYDGDMTVDAGTGSADQLNIVDALNISDSTPAVVSLTGMDIININSDADAAAETFTVLGTLVDGKTYIVKGNEATSKDTLSVGMTATSLDLSGLIVDDSSAKVTITNTNVAAIAQNILGSNGADTFNNSSGTGVVTIDGKAGDDVITTGTGNDSITAGEGADIITASAGNDTITLTESVAAIDNVILNAVATNGKDTIIGFAAGTGIDTISVAKANTEAQTAGTTGDVLAFAAESTALVTGGAAFVLASNSSTKGLIEIETTLDDDVTLSLTSTGADLMQALSSDATAAGSITINAASDIGFLVVYQNNNAYLWHYTEGDTATAVEADEIQLVAVLNGVASGTLASGDFILA